MRSSRPGGAKLGTVELVGEAFVGVWNEVPSMDDLLIKFIIKFRTLIAGHRGSAIYVWLEVSPQVPHGQVGSSALALVQ